MAWFDSGIDFKRIEAIKRDQIIQRLSGEVELQRRRRPIGRHLLGNDVVKAIEISHQSLPGEDNIEEELLFETLLRWCQNPAGTATGLELFEHLESAKCSPQILSLVKVLLGLSQIPAQPEGAAIDRQPQAQQALPRAVPFMAAQGTPPSHPHAALFASADFMSQWQAMMQSALMVIQNSTMQAVTTTMEQFRADFDARHRHLEAEIRALRSHTKPPLEYANYLRSVVNPMPGEKAWCQAVHLKDKLVVAGGFSCIKQPCKRVFVLNILLNEWYESEPTPYALSSIAADPHGNKMFVIGGCSASGGQAVDAAFTLGSNLKHKEALPKLILKVCRAASTVHQGRLYVLGGEASWYENEIRYGHHGLYKLQILDLEDKSWTLGPELEHRNPWLDCYRFLSLGSLLICDRRHVLDTEKMAWRDEDLPHRPSGYSTAMSVVDDRLLVFGGDNDIKHVHELSDNMQVWRNVGEMTTTRRHATACTIGNTVYIVGGQSCNVFFSTAESFSSVYEQS